jgi:hypothetical protein
MPAPLTVAFTTVSLLFCLFFLSFLELTPPLVLDDVAIATGLVI